MASDSWVSYRAHLHYCAGNIATYLVVRKRKGPQPAAWGHFQTLTGLVDDRSLDPAGTLWWGNKGGLDDGIRRAGTSMRKEELGDIMMMDAIYAGR